MKNFMESEHVVFEMCELTDIQTHIQTLTSLHFAPLPQAKSKFSSEFTLNLLYFDAFMFSASLSINIASVSTLLTDLSHL